MTVFYTMKCVTNLHVGSGETNFSTVDKQVERDEITGFPMIYSTSLKGALREHATKYNQALVASVFGREGDGDGSGKVKFLDAHLLARPMRASQGKQVFYMVTTKQMLHQFLDFLLLAGQGDAQLLSSLDALPNGNICLYREAGEEVVGVEGIEVSKKLEDAPFNELITLLKKALGEQYKTLILLDEQDFNESGLPVRARNKVKKREDKNSNLWYEEHVPYKSVFYTMVLETGEKDSAQALAQLTDLLDTHSLVQIGANATVGFGLMSLTKW
ncbi:TPA: type III-B CRISPR module RAMP protein Cmr4 [Streptococcus suis]